MRALVVRCGGGEHRVELVERAGGYDFELCDHTSGFDVVVALGGRPSRCHDMVAEIRDAAFRFQMNLRVVFDWYACGFSHTNMLAWGRHCGPDDAQRWQALGVTASQLRRLSSMKLAEPLTPETFSVWKEACTYGKKMELAIIQEFIDNDVRTGGEALAWRHAGLWGPCQLPALRRQGVRTPEKLAKRAAVNRHLVASSR